jgi:hypothetical protein
VKTNIREELEDGGLNAGDGCLMTGDRDNFSGYERGCWLEVDFSSMAYWFIPYDSSDPKGFASIEDVIAEYFVPVRAAEAV